MKVVVVIFNSKITFILHIVYMVAKTSSMLSFIYRNSKTMVSYTHFFNYVRSILEYCSIIWNPFYRVHTIRIERIHKRFTKFAIKSLHWNLELPSYDTRCLLLGIQYLEIHI